MKRRDASKLALSKETLKALTVRTHVRAGQTINANCAGIPPKVNAP